MFKFYSLTPPLSHFSRMTVYLALTSRYTYIVPEICVRYLIWTRYIPIHILLLHFSCLSRSWVTFHLTSLCRECLGSDPGPICRSDVEEATSPSSFSSSKFSIFFFPLRDWNFLGSFLPFRFGVQAANIMELEFFLYLQYRTWYVFF